MIVISHIGQHTNTKDIAVQSANLRVSVTGFRILYFFSEKNTVGPQEAQYLQFLLQWTMDHDPLYFEVHILLDPHDLPYMSKTQKWAISIAIALYVGTMPFGMFLV